MSEQGSTAEAMRTVRFHEYGEPTGVLALERALVPEPGPERIRIVVHACGLNPADWELCRGFAAGALPRGVGCDVSGTVDAVGEGVEDIAVGDLVFGTADWANCPSAGASDQAIMDNWFPLPDGLDLIGAGALTMVVDTADLHLRALGVSAGTTLFVYGAGGMVGFAAVQLALMRGARVIAAAGETFAGRLRELGAEVTSYGEGMVGRVLEITGGPVDLALDTGPRAGVLPQLLEIAGGEKGNVLTISDFEAAQELGVRFTFGEDPTQLLDGRYGCLPEVARLVAEGRFSIPVAETFPLEDWRRAVEISLGKSPHGKLVLLPGLPA